jgi:hypothetical protein
MQNPCDVPPEIEGRIPPHLKKGLNALLSHEAKILEQLNSNPQLAQTFITNPARALAQMGIVVDSQLAAALSGAAGRPNPFTTKTYKLPDGSKITPSMKVTFVKHNPAKSG